MKQKTFGLDNGKDFLKNVLMRERERERERERLFPLIYAFIGWSLCVP